MNAINKDVYNEIKIEQKINKLKIQNNRFGGFIFYLVKIFNRAIMIITNSKNHYDERTIK